MNKYTNIRRTYIPFVYFFKLVRDLRNGTVGQYIIPGKDANPHHPQSRILFGNILDVDSTVPVPINGTIQTL